VGTVAALERTPPYGCAVNRASKPCEHPPRKTARSIAEAQQRRSWLQLRQVDTAARPLLMEQKTTMNLCPSRLLYCTNQVSRRR
jgi:hypothetical protein